MFLLVYSNGTCRVVTTEEEVTAHLRADGRNTAYGFMGWQMALDGSSEEPVNKPAEPRPDRPADDEGSDK